MIDAVFQISGDFCLRAMVEEGGKSNVAKVSIFILRSSDSRLSHVPQDVFCFCGNFSIKPGFFESNKYSSLTGFSL